MKIFFLAVVDYHIVGPQSLGPHCGVEPKMDKQYRLHRSQELGPIARGRGFSASSAICELVSQLWLQELWKAHRRWKPTQGRSDMWVSG